jgi:hypothetical protein
VFDRTLFEIDHFRWEGLYLVSRTPIGRVTVAVLKINDPFRVELREEVLAKDRFPPRRSSAFRTPTDLYPSRQELWELN